MLPTGRPAWPAGSIPEVALAGVLLAIAAAAWAAVLRMPGMDAGPWSYPADFGAYAGTWIAMTAAMMLPSIVPTALRYERAVRGQRGPRTALAMSAGLVAGYVAIWSAAGLIPFALLEVGGAFGGGRLSGGPGARYLAAGALAAAAVYQLLPAKHALLRRLRTASPLHGDAGRGGGIGALRAGLECGGWCLGCTWALMASLFALGLMAPFWMIVVWAMVMGERLLPARRLAVLGAAAGLAALAIGAMVGAPI